MACTKITTAISRYLCSAWQGVGFLGTAASRLGRFRPVARAAAPPTPSLSSPRIDFSGTAMRPLRLMPRSRTPCWGELLAAQGLDRAVHLDQRCGALYATAAVHLGAIQAAVGLPDAAGLDD